MVLSMKETIERKLGCTIEEYMDNLKKRIESERKYNMETEEEKSDLRMLSIDEISFMIKYLKAQGKSYLNATV